MTSAPRMHASGQPSSWQVRASDSTAPTTPASAHATEGSATAGSRQTTPPILRPTTNASACLNLAIVSSRRFSRSHLVSWSDSWVSARLVPDIVRIPFKFACWPSDMSRARDRIIGSLPGACLRYVSGWKQTGHRSRVRIRELASRGSCDPAARVHSSRAQARDELPPSLDNWNRWRHVGCPLEAVNMLRCAAMSCRRGRASD